MIFEQTKVVRCHGCGGTGKQMPDHPMGFPRDCGVCGGTGLVRMSREDNWCGHCRGTGREKVGPPGFTASRQCHICGGTGIVQV